MIGIEDWSCVVENEGHYVIVATYKGSVGCVYAGQIALSGASFVAMPSNNLTRLGRGYGAPKSFGTHDKALEWLVAEAQALARKLHVGVSGVGEDAVRNLMKPLIS